MKSVMICNAVIKSVFAVCVTVAAVYFHNAGLLWWYVLLLLLGFEYKETPIKKGAKNEER